MSDWPRRMVAFLTLSFRCTGSGLPLAAGDTDCFGLLLPLFGLVRCAESAEFGFADVPGLVDMMSFAWAIYYYGRFGLGF